MDDSCSECLPSPLRKGRGPVRGSMGTRRWAAVSPSPLTAPNSRKALTAKPSQGDGRPAPSGYFPCQNQVLGLDSAHFDTQERPAGREKIYMNKFQPVGAAS